MSTQSELVYDVVDFDRDVLERSAKVPVLVDFWAPWCGPCRMLSPVLEALAEEFAGAFVLAKVNVDDVPEPAAVYKVSGIPDVKLFVDGEVAAGFVGALPRERVRAFLEQHVPSEVDRLVGEGHQLIAAGKQDRAAECFERALALDADNPGAHAGLARLALGRRDFEALTRHAKAISPRSNEHETARFLEQAAQLIHDADAVGDEAAVRARLDANPDDVDARFALGGHRLAAHDYRGALEAYFAVAKHDRKWRDEAPRKAMLTVFGVLGVRHPLSDAFRRQLMVVY